MGSYENIIKIEELRKKMEEGDIFSAQRILDTMDIRKVKNISDLGIVAEVYMENEHYEEALQLYLKIYDKTKTRKALFNLVEISIKRNSIEDAEYYWNEYKKAAPKDFYLYIFRYRIDKMKGVDYETLIDTLLTLKEIEYTEQWAYELAKLYYKAGMEKECIQECSDIVLWFGEGPYVEKAKILRSYYSGEADKNTIMEEIRRRAQMESQKANQQTGRLDDAEGLEESDIAEKGNDKPDRYEEASEKPSEYEPSEQEATACNPYEEEIYSETAFMQEDEIANMEYELSRDIQNMLISEPEATLEEERNTQEILGEGEYIQQQEMKERAEAEQEVEDTIYRLLQEEDVDEEDRKLKQLNQELKINTEDIFGNFLHVKTIKKQVVKSLMLLVKDNKKPVQIIITGAEGAGKTTLAKDMALFLSLSGKLRSSKIAKIKAEKLNTIDILSKQETLKDCCMVVEIAGLLNRNTIEGIQELSARLNGEIAIIYEEEKKNINKMFREYPKLMDLCKNRIHLPQYTQEELMGFALACLLQKDYKINSKAEGKLRNRVLKIAKDTGSDRQLEHINGLMQMVMNSADIRTGKELSNLAIQGRLKDVEVLTILPEDIK